MVSAQEKREIDEKAIKMTFCSGQLSQMQHQLHAFLLRDTVSGKLYKYRTFDSNGYALENLKNGTLHCSKPDTFNDPFDCKNGVTFKALYEAKYGEEQKVIYAILEKFKLVVYGEMEVSESSVDENRIIRKLLANKKLKHFIIDNQDTVQMKEEVLEELKDFLISLMQIILKDEKFVKNWGIIADMLPHIIKNISLEGMLQISDDNEPLRDYARANGIKDDTDEIGLIVCLGKHLFPENIKVFEEIQSYLDDVMQKMESWFLVGSLCTDFKNRLMWSHYADSHKGFCVEYDYSGTDEDTLSKLPLPVFYTERRPLIPWEIDEENIEEIYAKLILGAVTKDRIWEYENEWRILINATGCTEFKMPRVSCIYLGEAICENDRDEIIKIARQCCIPVKQMRMDHGTYDLHAEDVIL